jgi:hypothetical protein
MQKTVWKRIGSLLRFVYDEKSYLLLDSTCFAVGKDTKFITAYLNSMVGNYLLNSSPMTGTGDLIISVQALEPILIPPQSEPLCRVAVDKIMELAVADKDFAEAERELDNILFDYFGFTVEERKYIAQTITKLRQ